MENPTNITSVECLDLNEFRFQGEKTYILHRSGFIGTSTRSGLSMDELKEIVAYGRDNLKGEELELLDYIASTYKL